MNTKTRAQAAAEANAIYEQYPKDPLRHTVGNPRAMRVLYAIRQWDRPYAMTIRDVQEAAGLPSVSHTQYWLRYWRGKHRVEWEDGKPRTIRLVEP